MSTVFGTWPRLYLTPEDEPDEGGRVPLLRDTHVLALPVSEATVRAYTSIPVSQLPVSISPTAALHQLTHQESPMRRYDYDAHIHEVAGTSGIGRPLPERERHDATLRAIVWLGAIIGGGVFWYGLLVLVAGAWKALFG